MPPSDPPSATFPLEKREIHRERLRIALRSPLTWLPLAAVIALAIIAKPPVYVTAVALLATLIALWVFWRAQTPYLERKVAGHLIGESNLEQEQALRGKMEQLSRAGRDGYAITLGKFLQLKRGIEAELHRDGEVEPAEANVEELIDSLCAGVGEQFDTVLKVEQRQAAVGRSDPEWARLEEKRRDLLGQVIDSFKALKRTSRELAYILDPTKVAEANAEPVRDVGELADKLRAEGEIARRTRERMERDAIEF